MPAGVTFVEGVQSVASTRIDPGVRGPARSTRNTPLEAPPSAPFAGPTCGTGAPEYNRTAGRRTTTASPEDRGKGILSLFDDSDDEKKASDQVGKKTKTLWATHEVSLLAKFKNAILVGDYRPIAVLPVLFKLYSRVLYMLGETVSRPLRAPQFAFRKYHQAQQVVFILTQLI